MLRLSSGGRRLASLAGTPGEKFSQEETMDKRLKRQTNIERYDLFSWEAYQALMAFSYPAKFFRWRKGPIPALKDLEVERDRLN